MDRMGRDPQKIGNELNHESTTAAPIETEQPIEKALAQPVFKTPFPLVGPPLINKASSARPSNNPPSPPESLEQLLERQWEQGSQFLMEQTEHFDIASLLSCLHKLKTANVHLEDHVNSLEQRRAHLLAVNARLAIPITTSTPDAEVTPPPAKRRSQSGNGFRKSRCNANARTQKLHQAKKKSS